VEARRLELHLEKRDAANSLALMLQGATVKTDKDAGQLVKILSEHGIALPVVMREKRWPRV
jgi:hypothetical protein